MRLQNIEHRSRFVAGASIDVKQQFEELQGLSEDAKKMLLPWTHVSKAEMMRQMEAYYYTTIRRYRERKRRLAAKKQLESGNGE